MTRSHPKTAIFSSGDERYFADTCEPLREGVASGDVCLVARARGSYPGTLLPESTVPEVRTLGYWDAVHDQSWGLDWHRNEGVEITYLARGRLGFAVGEQSFTLKPGDLTITRPWQPHRVGLPDVSASRLYWLIIDVGVRRPNQEWKWPHWLLWSDRMRELLTMNLSHNEEPVWHASQEIAHYFEQLGDHIGGCEADLEDGRLKLYINGLLISLAEMLAQRKPLLDPSLSSTERTVELFLASLRDHCDEPWTLDSMAQSCGLGRSRFIHYCKQTTNMSPNEYLTWCRVKHAQRILASDPEIAITKVAMDCGFSTSQYFSTVFRKSAGCSPRQFRTQASSSAGQD